MIDRENMKVILKVQYVGEEALDEQEKAYYDKLREIVKLN